MDPLLLDASSKDMLEGTVAAGLVYTLHIGVPLLVATMALVRALIAGRRGRLADAQCVAGASIEPGSPAVLHGAVELAPGRQVAMRVEIDQRGRQQKTKNGWSHSWTETARRVVAEPFYVMDRRGARVRVEVSERSQLIDAADRVVRTEETARTRIVELSPGEEVYVIGELVRERDPNAGSYRGADTALVMRPPPRGKLLISTERLGDRFRAVARYERISAICFVIFAILFSTFDLGFYARKFRGQREIADVTAFELSTGKNRRCLVEGRFADGETFGGDLTTGWCEDLDAVRATGKTPRVPAVRVPGSGWLTQIGREPGVHVVSPLMGGIFLALALLGYWARTKPWYEAKVTDSGGGPLPPMTEPG